MKGIRIKKDRSPVNIDKEIHLRIKHLIKTHPELEYKKLTRFVNKTLDEKLQDIQTNLIIKMIENAGIESFVFDAKELRSQIPKILEDIKARSFEIGELKRNQEESIKSNKTIEKLERKLQDFEEKEEQRNKEYQSITESRMQTFKEAVKILNAAQKNPIIKKELDEIDKK